ncbi:hypothetical protein [Allokutzneria oryzae]|uniref:Uncharacterized protein n=1 Tax=Allokutzneria oryzae TaxID=1378989 RepID=A0ABV6A2K3_9PSEU
MRTVTDIKSGTVGFAAVNAASQTFTAVALSVFTRLVTTRTPRPSRRAEVTLPFHGADAESAVNLSLNVFPASEGAVSVVMFGAGASP